MRRRTRLSRLRRAFNADDAPDACRHRLPVTRIMKDGEWIDGLQPCWCGRFPLVLGVICDNPAAALTRLEADGPAIDWDNFAVLGGVDVRMI